MPEETMASAISRTILSLTWLRNLFQLFQPMGGVLARPLLFTAAGKGRETGGALGGRGLGTSVETRASSTTWGAPRPGPPGPRPGAAPGGGWPGAPPGPAPGGGPPRPGPRPPPNRGTVSFSFSPSRVPG